MVCNNYIRLRAIIGVPSLPPIFPGTLQTVTLEYFDNVPTALLLQYFQLLYTTTYNIGVLNLSKILFAVSCGILRYREAVLGRFKLVRGLYSY